MALVTTFDGGRKFINHYTIDAADTDTAQTLHLAAALSARDLHSQVQKRCPDAPILDREFPRTI